MDYECEDSVGVVWQARRREAAVLLQFRMEFEVTSGLAYKELDPMTVQPLAFAFG